MSNIKYSIKRTWFLGALSFLVVTILQLNVKADTIAKSGSLNGMRIASALFSKTPTVNNNNGCAKNNCKILADGDLVGNPALDVNVPLGKCYIAFSLDGCENDKSLVCAYRYVYNGLDDCTYRTTQTPYQVFELVEYGKIGTADNPSIPNYN